MGVWNSSGWPLLGWEAFRILSSVSLAGTGIAHFSLIDTCHGGADSFRYRRCALPPIREVARWLLPVLAVAWALASGFGRSLVLRRYDPSLRFAPWLMVGLQLLRILVLGGQLRSVVRWVALGGMVVAQRTCAEPGSLFR